LLTIFGGVAEGEKMKKIGFVSLATALVCAAAFAQGPPPGPPHHGFGPGMGMGMHPGKVVKGAPYSASVTNSTVQSLQDGNTIQHSTSGSVARDSQGRTYEQMTFNGDRFGQNGPTTLVFINDPVGGYAYTLNASTKVAFRRALKAHPGGAPPHPPGDEAGPDAANRVVSDLGTQLVGGVTATGKSVTHTIPAGSIGNALAVVTTSETWTSPDLQIPVLAKRSDPRFGQTTYSLTNIQRTEPPASLFQVPPDYTVKDAPAHPAGPGAPPPPQ
jgi:hypothetical protein